MILDSNAIQSVTEGHFDSEEAYINYLYRIFLDHLVTNKLPWAPNGTVVSCRRGPEVQGRHNIFWHVISGGARDDGARRLEEERCRRIHLIRPMVVEFNRLYPSSAGGKIRWWLADHTKSRHSRYIIAVDNFSYMVVIEEREKYALLVTAYDVLYPRRQKKLQAEWEDYWKKQGPPA